MASGYPEIEGFAELMRQLERVEKVPKSVATKAAREGIKDPLKDAKANAPELSGTLKNGIIKILEKAPRKKCKSVYRIVFDRALNPVFQKPIKNPGIYGGKKPTGYYPVSQEYGFNTANGYEPGLYFVRDALAENEAESTRKIVKRLGKEIDKLLK
ncbi:HK97 gp10 family phage protein [Bacillus sp. FJAT-29814]|uniref:HK97 gp10 family phage protein n=1 Tax=Bacillus sp. FJAT-29814 TaxID=1729688 RepID=UPI0009E73CEC|nr:HK97 gp10 family phage protein [Bacillus sp. FJAT-29814]